MYPSSELHQLLQLHGSCVSREAGMAVHAVTAGHRAQLSPDSLFSSL